jgi:hypothetical protein
MSSRNESSSDLELARALSRRLTGATVPGGASPAQPGYARFPAQPSASRGGPASGLPEPVAAAVVPERAGLTIELRRFDSWETLLDWCRSLTATTNAFVMDPEGFAIAHSGPLAADEVQGIGSQLMVAMTHTDQLDHAGTPAITVCIEYGAFWLTGMRVVAEGRGAFTVGLLSAVPIDRDSRDAIRLQVANNLEHL